MTTLKTQGLVPASSDPVGRSGSARQCPHAVAASPGPKTRTGDVAKALAQWTRRLLCAGFLGGWAISPVQAQEPALGSNVQGLLDYARAHNPELAAMRHEAAAAAERVQPAGALPDPMFRVELENLDERGLGGRPSPLPWKVGETKYTLLQSFPAWGKRGLQRDVANAQLQQAQARSAATGVEIAAKLKTAYAQYYLAAGNERLAREILDLMAQLEQVAQARYAGGLVAQQDAIRAQLEQTAMRAELIAMEQDKRMQRARLNALLNRDAAAPLAEPQALRPLPDLSVLDAQTLAQRARDANPALQAEQAGLLGAERQRELTLRNRWPDLQVGVSPTQMGSKITAWALMVEINIPLQRETRRAQERESEAMVEAARARAQALASQLLGEMGETLAGLDAARRSQALISTQLLPQSELSLRSALAAYENGKADFATLLDAQRQIRKARQDLLKAQVDAQLRLAEIERILGETL